MTLLPRDDMQEALSIESSPSSIDFYEKVSDFCNFSYHMLVSTQIKKPPMKQRTSTKILSLGLLMSIVALGVSWGYASPRSLSGIFGKAHSLGQFSSAGNTGRAFVNGYSVDTGSTTDSIKVTGKEVFLETVGWVTLTKDQANLPSTSNIDIEFTALPSETTITNYALKNPLYGWSDNAGWIDFSPTNVSSGLIYMGGGLGAAGEGSFSGAAWSDTLGWLDFSASTLDFQNKVKVIGSIGGNKTFDVAYNVGARFNSVSVANLLNTVRKNIGLMTRGITVSSTQTTNTINITTATAKPLNKDTIIYRVANGTVMNVEDLMKNNEYRTIIVEGSDVIISTDIEKKTGSKSRAIIVMKNDA
jgi:hypothetical protein